MTTGAAAAADRFGERGNGEKQRKRERLSLLNLR